MSARPPAHLLAKPPTCPPARPPHLLIRQPLLTRVLICAPKRPHCLLARLLAFPPARFTRRLFAHRARPLTRLPAWPPGQSAVFPLAHLLTHHLPARLPLLLCCLPPAARPPAHLTKCPLTRLPVRPPACSRSPPCPTTGPLFKLRFSYTDRPIARSPAYTPVPRALAGCERSSAQGVHRCASPSASRQSKR